jgi:hypothetical protein
VALPESVCLDLAEDGAPVGFETLHAEPNALNGVTSLQSTAALRDLVNPGAS